MLTDVVLFSGGMDSAAILLGRPKETTVALFFYYGQGHADAEGTYAARFSTRHGYGFKRLTLPALAGGICSGDASPVVPGRNALFLAHACSFAESVGALRVWIGCTREDRKVFPDCRPQFVRAFNELNASAGLSVEVRAPLVLSSKRDVSELLTARGGDAGETWSCYRPVPSTSDALGWVGCGECGACKVRGAVDHGRLR